ncbi:DUF5682 family protein [Polymorphospora sp. NPDC050346]|uniref:DUF5682 family protein n=1 Tax=Polymorphospora sp. NPDC050346 TaxID=3155780 RepID=UPI0033D31954
MTAPSAGPVAGVTYLGVRHHSPACARLVASTIEALRPAYVLVEGPADVNDRLDELLLGHRLPVAVFTSYRDGTRAHASWSPFCDYSPEWVALTTGRRLGAEVRFIDLPAWHPAFADRTNRYADAERRYAEVVDRLCRTFAVDNVDTLWDHLFEIQPDDGLAERLATYFDLLRDESTAGDDDCAREAYMARWVDAAATRADGRPVVVVSGGFHRPALIRLAGTGDGRWPDVPRPPDGARGGSFLVPYSFRRLDSFDGYQSGMPSPDYYQRLWEHGPARAADDLTASVVARLRRRRQRVSTADLVAARTMAAGLARVRGHRPPARVDILDGLVSALVDEALEVPLPWTSRGPLPAGTHPVVVEMVAALSGDRVGQLHPDTPLPPLVGDVTAELERHGLGAAGEVRLDLTAPADLARSRVLHRLRTLRVPGFRRESGPTPGVDAVLVERWSVEVPEERLSALIEASGYGATLRDAAVARLAQRATVAAGDADRLASVLFDAALCGIADLSGDVLDQVAGSVGAVRELASLGRVLAVALGLWRHDRLFGVARTGVLGAVISSATVRALWLAEGIRGGPAPAEPARLAAVAALRDAVVHAGPVLELDRPAVLAVAGRLAADRGVPPDLRGAMFGLTWALGTGADPVAAVRTAGGTDTLGDWLAGLFALAREEILTADTEPGPGDGRPDLLGVLDGLVTAMPEREFLVALPGLRQAFAYFPPREREGVAGRLLARRGVAGSGRALLRTAGDPVLFARGRELDADVEAVLARAGLLPERALSKSGSEVGT